jgi:hypothetical protein
LAATADSHPIKLCSPIFAAMMPIRAAPACRTHLSQEIEVRQHEMV